MGIIPTCFELHVGYDWRVMALKPSLAFSFGQFFGFSRNNCVGVACMVYRLELIIPE